MIGYAFMGAAHSQAWRTVNHAYDLPLKARMRVVCGRDGGAVAAAADQLGWEEHATDWRQVIARDDIDLVDVCTPGDSHAEITLAALAAGKHVLCEKPLANTVDEARTMTEAALAAQAQGIRSMCGFNYRRVPAVALMRQLIAAGKIGTIRQVRAAYLQDWIIDPDFPLVWRLQKERAGSGALGDIGAHIIDLAQHLTDQRISTVTALTETFIPQRPLPTSAPTGLGGGAGPAGEGREMGEVTVDDAALFLARLDGGAIATFEATRFAAGRKNAITIEINGSTGSLAFDFERMNELQYHSTAAPIAEQGFTRILVTEPEHPYLAPWWPPGHTIGYEHTFTHQAHDLIQAIHSDTDPSPSFTEALQIQQVLHAVGESAGNGRWTSVEKAA
ncbi:Gfo/Idh/MocA family oxidoreductase [Solwaraspora sp. WMMD1047]|uniref:Gfo/Idh/MocA family protein n=1 Tax=Solwaraspora sp. WMMD1047 TaxID=3016102 RepID=UPI00241616C7|nr:Gfo/Idh/MocA family oxidoreductase [Solwaraspora sp. WMMD1047]MDG4828952.1 Gfo/Idh/MocA family oxidoreductase [Solwaraspora sp. WMMD1047]